MGNTELESYYPIIRKRLFHAVADGDLAAFLAGAVYEVRDVERGAYLFHDNDTVKSAGIVLSGELVVTKGYPDGTESIFDILHPSRIFGLDVAITHKGVSPFSVFSSKASRVVVFPFVWDDFFEILPEAAQKPMMQNIIRHISDENMRKQRKIEIISQKGLRDRISTYFEIMRERYGSSFRIPYSREQLADYLCVNRSALSHELGQMKRDGLIDYRMDRFILL